MDVVVKKSVGQNNQNDLNNIKAVSYFKLNKYSQRLPLENQTSYYGSHSAVRNSWRPYGEGEYQLNDEKLMKGNFNKDGFMQGNGEIAFYKEEKLWALWEGGFQNGQLSGPGHITDQKEMKKEAIIRDNKVICTRDDLQLGQQIEFNDQSFQVCSGSRRAIILGHLKEWRYRVRFHDDIRPRERDVDFALSTNFTILHHLPLISHFSHFPSLENVEKRKSQYDYFKDTYGTSKPSRLGIAGGRHTAEMKTKNVNPLLKNRVTSDHRESLFELAAVGIGGTIEMECARMKKEERLRQWEVVVAKRKADQAKERTRLIEEESRKEFELALLKQRQDVTMATRRRQQNCPGYLASGPLELMAKHDALDEGCCATPDSMMDGKSLLSNDSGKITYLDRTCHLRLGTGELFVFAVATRRVVKVLNLTSVLGSKALLANVEHDLSILEIYDYKFDDSSIVPCWKAKKLRKCEVTAFRFADSVTCQQWSNAINHAILSQSPSPVHVNACSSEEAGMTVSDAYLLAPPRPKRFMVFVNPVSGSGRAVSIWRNQVEPIMNHAGVEVKLVITQYANHARDIMEDFDPSAYDCIMTIGGDGMLFEVINGLSTRSKGDGEQVLRSIPVAPIPGGTGNGLAKSLLYESSEEYSVVNSTFMALKGTNETMDLSLVETPSQTYRSFLLLGWGLISDIDLLSESLRCLGEMRLYLAAAYFIIRKRSYRGRLSMFTGGSDGTNGQKGLAKLPPLERTILPGNGWEVIDGHFLFVWIVQTSHVTSSMHSGPGVTSDDGMFTIFVVTDMGRFDILRLLIAMDTGEHVNHPKVRTYKCTAYRIEPHNDPNNGGLYTLDGESVAYGPIQGIMHPGAAKTKKFRQL